MDAKKAIRQRQKAAIANLDLIKEGDFVEIVNCAEAENHVGKTYKVVGQPKEICGTWCFFLEGKGAWDAGCVKKVDAQTKSKTKGMQDGVPIKYWVRPEPIEVRKVDWPYICTNCGGYDSKRHSFVFRLNESDHLTKKSNVGKFMHAKPTYLALCEDCFDELLIAMSRAWKG